MAEHAEPNFRRSIPKDQSWGGCWTCRHFESGYRCVAFPERIPLHVFSGEIDHLVVRPGQAGTTTWELTPAPAGLARRLIAAAQRRGAAWAAGVRLDPDPEPAAIGDEP